MGELEWSAKGSEYSEVWLQCRDEGNVRSIYLVKAEKVEFVKFLRKRMIKFVPMVQVKVEDRNTKGADLKFILGTPRQMSTHTSSTHH